VYFSPKSVEMAGCDRAMTAAAAGTTRRAAYFTEYWKTFFNVSVSFCGFKKPCDLCKKGVRLGVEVVVVLYSRSWTTTSEFKVLEDLQIVEEG